MKNIQTIESRLIKKFGAKINTTSIDKIEDYAVLEAKSVIHSAILKASHNKFNQMSL